MQVRPMLEGHGGDAKLVDYADGVVWLEMQGGLLRLSLGGCHHPLIY